MTEMLIVKNNKFQLGAIAFSVFLQITTFAQTITHDEGKCIKIRGAFDIGSEKTKFKVFKINVCTGKIIGKPIYPSTDEEKAYVKKHGDLPFEVDMRKTEDDAKANGTWNEEDFPQFSGSILTKALREIKTLKDNADLLPTPPTDYIGVATEAFRRSNNSDLIIGGIERLGIKMLIPKQEQEALIEWKGVAASVTDKDSDNQEIKPKNIVSWGIGGGSMQFGIKMRDGNDGTFTSKLASIKMHNDAVERIMNAGNLLDRGLTTQDIDDLVAVARKEASRAPEDFVERIQDDQIRIYGVGGVINASLNGFLKLQNNSGRFFTPDDVREALYSLAGKKFDDKIFGTLADGKLQIVDHKYQELLPTNLALIYGVMKQFRISKVFFADLDNTYGSPFFKDFAIKMVYKKPVPKKKIIQSSDSGNSTTAQTQEEPRRTSAVVTVDAGGDDENRSVCESSIHTYDDASHKVCRISGAPVTNPSWCTGGIKNNGTECWMSGNPKLVYKYEGPKN